MSSVLGPGGRPVQARLDPLAQPRPQSADAVANGALFGPDAAAQLMAPGRRSAAQPNTQFVSLLSELKPKAPVQIAGPADPPAGLGRIAANVASTPLPTRQAMRADPLLGGREKSNLLFGLWTRSTPYKQVLAEVDAYHALTDPSRAAADAPDVDSHLEQIEQQLTRLRQSVDDYVQSDNQRLSRKPAMRNLLANVDTELQRVNSLRAALSREAPPAQQIRWPKGLPVERGLAFLRAGLPLSDLQWAHDQSITPQTLAQALPLGLPREAIALVARYPTLTTPAEIQAELTQGRPLEHLATAFELGIDSDQLPTVLPIGEAARITRLTELHQRAREMVDAARANGKDYRLDKAFNYIVACSRSGVPNALVKLSFSLGLNRVDAIVLHRAAVPDDAISAGARAGLTGSAIAFAHESQLDFAQVAQLLELGLSHDEVRAALRPPADPVQVATWQAPQAGEPGFSWPLAVLLAKAGVPADRIGLREVRDLLALRASPEQIADIAAANHNDATLRPYLQLPGRPPVTRAEAMLLNTSGLTAEAAGRYRHHTADTPNGERAPVIPISGPTVQRGFKPADQSGAPQKLGSGNFNTVYLVRFNGSQPGETTERVFKPIQRPDGSRRPAASSALGISRSLPRYELRNVVCSRIDRALGFGVIPHTDIGVVTQANGRPEIGVLMERIGGMTGSARIVAPVDITDTDLGRDLAATMRGADGPQRIADWCRRNGDPKVDIRNGRVLLTGGKVSPKVLPQDTEYQRKLVSLQLFDALVGQGDRHDLNWMRVADASGKTVRIVGIDNDQSLGREPDDPELLREGSDIDRQGALRGVGLPPIVDHSQFDAIMALNDSQLAALAGGLISNAELDAMRQRLLVIQDHLLRLDEQRKVIAPSAWGEQTLRQLAAPAPDVGDGNEPSSYLGRIYAQQRHRQLTPLPPELIA